MSRNNLILVIYDKYRKMYYVARDVNADTEWSTESAVYLFQQGTSFTRNRGKALILAHNADRKLQTEYGVREISINTKVCLSSKEDHAQ